MRVTRRTWLGTVPAVAMAGCAPDPTVHGAPAAPQTQAPASPTQSPTAQRAARAVAGLRAVALQASKATPWTEGAWVAAVAGLVTNADAHLDRLLSEDPLQDGLERTFHVEEPTAAPTADIAAARAALARAADTCVAECRACVGTAVTQPERLLYASLAAAATAAKLPQLAAAPSKGSPIRFPDSPLAASLDVALSRVWALVGGIELGLGRLDKQDPLHTLGTTLLNEARALRNDLRDAVTDGVPEQEVAYKMPNAMTTPAEIRAGWGQLEHGVLDGLARLVASGTGESPWLDRMLLQVGRSQSLGSAMSRWPGWAEL